MKFVVTNKKTFLYQEGLEDGQLNEARKKLLRAGRRLLGEPPAELAATLNAISDLAKLDELFDRVFSIDRWDDLLPA